MERLPVTVICGLGDAGKSAVLQHVLVHTRGLRLEVITGRPSAAEPAIGRAVDALAWQGRPLIPMSSHRRTTAGPARCVGTCGHGLPPSRPRVRSTTW